MKGTTEVVKGRIEEAAGALVDSDKLRLKGQADQAVGHVRQVGERSVNRAKESARKFVDRAKHAAQDAVDKAKTQ
jgi:uncharacterized protein YjbJ (UPF0337 family)